MSILFLLFVSLANSLMVNHIPIKYKFTTKPAPTNHWKPQKIRNILHPVHKKNKPRFRTPRLELAGYDGQQEWFMVPLSTPGVLATLSQWLHEYDSNSTEAQSIQDMMVWQEMVAIKDTPGFHLSIGLCCENTVRAVAQFQSVHNDNNNMLLVGLDDDVMGKVSPITVRAIATSVDEEHAVSMLIDIFEAINNGPMILNGRPEMQQRDKYINFNWKRLKFVPRWFLAMLYKLGN